MINTNFEDLLKKADKATLTTYNNKMNIVKQLIRGKISSENAWKQCNFSKETLKITRSILEGK